MSSETDVFHKNFYNFFATLSSLKVLFEQKLCFCGNIRLKDINQKNEKTWLKDNFN